MRRKDLTASLFHSAWLVGMTAAFPGAAAAETSSGDGPPGREGGTAAAFASRVEDGAGAARTDHEAGEIVVTGSRLARPELSSPHPIQSFTSAALEQSGDTNITDFLVDTPALIGSSGAGETSGSNIFFQSAGLNLLDLRNLGTRRTLVLVNGRRHVAAYPGASSVDINSIPLGLIERVDVLTGGTSAVYGADGVSGVVNFVLRRDFEGVEGRGQFGVSERGDAGNRYGSVVAGANFAGGRGNVAFAFEHGGSDRLNDRDRAYSGDPLRRFELLRGGPQGAGVERALFNDVRWQDSSPDAAVDLGGPVDGAFLPGAFDLAPDRTGSGSVYDRGVILAGSGGRTIGGSGTPTAGYYGDFRPFLERHNLNALASFEFSPAIRFFAEGKYATSTAYTVSQPTFDFGIALAADNAFLRQRYGPELTRGGALVIGRDNLDFGIRGDRAERETVRAVVGIEGRLNSNLRYELSLVHGRSSASTRSQNERVRDRYFAALDAVVGPDGRIICRIDLPGETIIDPVNFGAPATTFRSGECVPLNLLGNGVASPEALDFVQLDHTTRNRIGQQVVSGYLAGDAGFGLGGGPIGFALGAEYRKETSRSVPSEALQEGILLDNSEIEVERGSYDVKELFGEVTVPLLENRPLARTLTVGGALRYSDHSSIGGTATYKLDAVYAPVRDVTFRGTWSRAVRAPNINELFQPLSGAFEFVTDPCDVANLDAGSSSRRANCAAQLAALGLLPARIASFSPSSDPEASTTRRGRAGGDPSLREERAKTWTAGLVLRPRVLPGFSLAVDWYEIRLDGAINSFTATQAFALCVDQPTLDNPFCDLVERDPSTGFASGFTLRPQNVARFETAGLDVTLSYLFSPGPELGTFSLKLVGGYLDRLTFFNTPGSEPDEDAGELDLKPAPTFVGTADLGWTRGAATLNYGLAWHNRVRRFTREELRAGPAIAEPRLLRYKQRWEHDIQLAYAAANDLTVYAGINNLTDQKPSVSSGGAFPVDPVGRYFYFGIRTNLGERLGLF